MTAVFTLAWLGAVLFAGKLLRIAVPAFRRFFIPSSIIAGFLGLALGPEVWGRLDAARPDGWIGQPVHQAMATLPGFLINVVFAALFLGKVIPSAREVWRRAGPQMAFGQTLAWGMYMVGIGVTMLVLVPLWDVPPAFGTLLEIGFEGGHGTAAGLRKTFDTFDWPEGADLALGVATVGVVLGVVLGMALINWGVRTGRTVLVRREGEPAAAPRAPTEEEIAMSVESAEAPQAGAFAILSIEPLSLHVAYVGIAIGIGYFLLQALVALEAATLGRWGVEPLVAHVPLFPMAMIGGILLQLVHARFLSRLRLNRAAFACLQEIGRASWRERV